MFSLLCTVATLGVIGFALLIRAALVAPQGAEDEHGFHLIGVDKQTEAAKEALLSSSDLSFFTR